jgi:hypothetical protein
MNYSEDLKKFYNDVISGTKDVFCLDCMEKINETKYKFFENNIGGE